MVHSPTDDLFSPQQWEHWAMIFILVLGLVVGYGQAAAEDQRRAQRRRGGTTIGARQTRHRRSRRGTRPEQMQAIAPKLQRHNQSSPSLGHSSSHKVSTAHHYQDRSLPQIQLRQGNRHPHS